MESSDDEDVGTKQRPVQKKTHTVQSSKSLFTLYNRSNK